MIDPTILRECPERYAREPWLHAALFPEEREIVQDAIARRYLQRQGLLAPRPVPVAYQRPELSGVFCGDNWRSRKRHAV